MFIMLILIVLMVTMMMMLMMVVVMVMMTMLIIFPTLLLDFLCQVLVVCHRGDQFLQSDVRKAEEEGCALPLGHAVADVVRPLEQAGQVGLTRLVQRRHRAAAPGLALALQLLSELCQQMFVWNFVDQKFTTFLVFLNFMQNCMELSMQLSKYVPKKS